MTKRANDLVPEYVLGLLSDAEKNEVEQELKGSPDLRAEVAAASEAYAVLARSLPATKPPQSVKARLMASIARPEERFAPHADVLARYFDLTVERVRALLKSITDPLTVWNAGPLPGITLIDFDGGPRTAAADVGFVRLPAGLHFPWHRHKGHELNYVIEGSLRDFDGRIYGPGEAIEKETGTEHEFFVGSDKDALIAVVLFEGFDIIPKR
jgi:hypothetical protein